MSSFFRITLRRSTIGLPAGRAGTVKALGIRSRMQPVYHPVSPDIAGMILSIKELVDVEAVSRPLTKQQVHALRRPAPGFYVESRGSSIFEETPL